MDQSYYSQNGETQGYWFGDLAEQFALNGGVTKEHFDRLANGQHPETGEQLVRHRNVEGISEHRSAWDFTIAPHKSISAAALVGGDDRLVAAHRASIRAALSAAQEYTQARIGGQMAMTSGNFAAALFEHTTSRPVDGVPDPHLHTHAVVFNMTEAAGRVRAVDSREWFRIQSYITAVYQSEMAVRVQRLGYELERGKNFSAAIKGYTPEYLTSISRRTEHIEAEKEKRGFFGAKADHIIAHEGREAKGDGTPEQLRKKHRAEALAFGVDPDAVPNAARQREHNSVRSLSPDEAITFAKHKLIERSAVFDHYEVIREALRYGQGSLRRDDVEEAFRRRPPEFLQVRHYRASAPGHRYTTPEMIQMERESIAQIRGGIGNAAPFVPNLSEPEFRSQRSERLNAGQMSLVYGVLTSRDRFIGVQGGAGTGKTTALKPLQEHIAASGYETVGLAPTSGAARELAKWLDMQAQTLQRFLARGAEDGGKPRAYFLDESSLASTKQVDELLKTIRPQDRVLFVGDIQQHQSVEAGRVFEELQDAGMPTFALTQIVRQKDPELLKAVQSFAVGDVAAGLQLLDQQGRIHERASQHDRYAAIAQLYAADPHGTLVVSPDNESRQAINEAIRAQLRSSEQLGPDVFTVSVLRPRQDLTKEDLLQPFSYQPGDVIRYAKQNKSLDVRAGDYATVTAADDATITVRSNERVFTHHPQQAAGVQLFTTEKRSFAVEERIQFNQPWRERAIANRDLATITHLDENGNVRAKLDSGRSVGWNLKEMPHVDYGYALTSYSSQGQTVNRVLINVATQDSRVQQLVDQTLAYVATSRPRYDARIFTDDAKSLGNALSRAHENTTALSESQTEAYASVM